MNAFLFEVKSKTQRGAENLGFEIRRDVEKPINANGGLFIAVCRGKVIFMFDFFFIK